MTGSVEARPKYIAEIPSTVVTAGETLVLDAIHGALTVVLLTSVSIIVFNPVLFQNTTMIAGLAGVALLDIIVSSKRI
jgi:hypothetical protein